MHLHAGNEPAVQPVTGTGWRARAKQMAASVQAEYEAGKRGDDTPPAPIWATPQQQLDSLVALFRNSTGTSAPDPAPTPDAADPTGDDEDATAVVDAMRSVDWAGVRAATAERTAEATKAMREMADHVDWAKVQPVAAQVSSALIAAIATGQLGVGGRLGSTVARAITNQGGLGQQVAAKLQQTSSGVPADFSGTIDAASRDI